MSGHLDHGLDDLEPTHAHAIVLVVEGDRELVERDWDRFTEALRVGGLDDIAYVSNFVPVEVRGTYDVKPVDTAAPARWCFWVPDSDRNAGWTNHCYVHQYVCEGTGATPEEAWADAKANNLVPEGFILPETLTAIRKDAEQHVAAE